MKLSEIMTTNPRYIGPEENLQEAARQMRDLDVGMLPVGDGVKLKGAITDRDIVIRAVAEGTDPKSLTVADVMTPEITYLFEDQDCEEAVKVMEEKQIRRLVILNRDKDMVGIVALADLARSPEEPEKKAEAVVGVSQD